MSPITYVVSVDWDNDGTFVEAGDDITNQVLNRTGISIQYGRDQSRALSPPQSGQVNMEVDNRSGDYSPENTSSPLFGKLGPGRPVLIQAIHMATTYNLFQGQLDDFTIQPDRQQQSVNFSALDLLGKLRSCTAHTELHFSIRTGNAVRHLLDEIGWPLSKRQIDPGVSFMRWWWADGDDCFTAMQNLVLTEGPGALFSIDPDGNALFQDRAHRVLTPASTTSQATFLTTGTEPLFSEPFGYDIGWKDLINQASFNVEERAPGGRVTPIWMSDQASIAIDNGSTVQITVQADDPFFGAVPPEVDVDYLVVTGSTITVTLSRTSGQSTTINISASGGNAVISNLQLRGFAVPVVRTVIVGDQDPSSIEQAGLRDYPDEAPYASSGDALAIAQLVVAQRANPLPIISMLVNNKNDTRIAQMLTRDISDRITVVEPTISLNRDFYIEQIKHDINPDARYQSTTFGCEATLDVDNANVLILDQGELDVNTLGVSTFNDPSMVFLFDDPTQGQFDVGLFAT